MRVRGIGDGAERHRVKIRKARQRSHDEQNKTHIEENLARIKGFRSQFRNDRVFMNGASGAGLAKQENMSGNEQKYHCRD